MRNLYLLLILSLLSCDPDDDRFPPIDDDMGPDCPSYVSDHINIMWQSPLQPDTALSSSLNPILFEESVCFSDRFSADNRESVVQFDGMNGEINWMWDGEDREGASTIFNNENLIVDNHLFISTRKELHNISLETGIEEWEIDITGSTARIKAIGNYLYFVLNEFSGPATIKSTLMRTDVHGNLETIFSKAVLNNFEPGIEMPSLYMADNTDSILVFQNYSYNFNSAVNRGKVDLIAFNLNAKQVEWEVEDVTADGNTSAFSPIINDDHVYFQGANSMHCLDVKTGGEIWMKQISPGSFFRCPNIIVGNKLIANRDNDHIYAFDLDTGDIIWDNPFTGSTVPNMDHYNGIIYFGSMGDGKLRGVRVSDGMLVLETNSPNEICDSGASFSGGVVIDQETGYLYTHDKFFAMGIDLN